MAPEVCMVRTAAAREFGLSPKRVKEPFLWSNLVDFALLYGVHSQGYCHLVEASMAILSLVVHVCATVTYLKQVGCIGVCCLGGQAEASWA